MNKTSKSEICLIQKINFSDKGSLSNPSRFIHTLIIFLFFSLLFVLNLTACDTTEPPIITPPPPVVKDTITISVESFTHRSISFNIKSTVHSQQSSIRVLRSFNSNTIVIAEYPIQTKDTTIIDDDNGTGLLLDTTYTYFAVRVDSLGQLKDTSNIVTQKTLAPTSHNYTWQEFVIGDAGFSNSLYDVWGTDENNVWAVGGAQINGKFYGAFHWNGVEWIADSTVGGSAIYGFNSNDIWVVGGGVYHYENGNWVLKDIKLNNGSVTILDSVSFANRPYTSVWGTSSSNLYLGNAWGKIIHWDGSKASVMNVTAESSVEDIWGFSVNDIYAVSGSFLNSYGELFQFNGNDWSTIRTGSYTISQGADTFGPFTSIWGNDASELYLTGLYIELKINNNWIIDNHFNKIFYHIRGSASNNIFISGAYGFVAHFNGVDWVQYTLTSQASLVGLQVFSNQVFIVGYNQNTAFIYRGLRQ
ncbi:MAG: hypothetical protein WAU11_09305 [Ignavibacteriaceae bacterium]